MTWLDGYWAAKIVMSFTHKQIIAAVETGKYSDPDATKYLVKTLIQRRNKIGKTFFGAVCPLEYFRIIDPSNREIQIHFNDLSVQYEFIDSDNVEYYYSVYFNDQNNRYGGDHRISSKKTTKDSQMLWIDKPAMEGLINFFTHKKVKFEDRFFYIKIESHRKKLPPDSPFERGNGKKLLLHLFDTDTHGFEIVGVDRER